MTEKLAIGDPGLSPAQVEMHTPGDEETAVRNAIRDYEELLEKKFGGPGFWLCLKKAFTPTISKDLTRAEDKQRIPEIAPAPETLELKDAQQDLVDALRSLLSRWNPASWYLWLQNYMSGKQFTKWQETKEDISLEQKDHNRHCVLAVLCSLWNFICSLFNFLRHFRRHPIESICTILLIIWWLFCLVWAFVVSEELKEKAFFVGASGTNSRSFVLVVSVLLCLNANIHVIIRWTNKRGLTPFASILAFGLVAYVPGWRHLYDEDEFRWTVLGISVAWSNLVFFYSEILFIIAVAFAVTLVALGLAFWPLSPKQRDMLKEKTGRLVRAKGSFNDLKKKHEAKISPIRRDEFDCLLQIADGTISLSSIYSKFTSSMIKRVLNTTRSFLRRAWKTAWSLFSWNNWSWKNVRMVFNSLWRAFKSLLMACLLLLPKLGFLAITGAFFFLQVFPFLDKPLLYISKINWGIQVSIKMLQCLPFWRSVIFMGDQASYLVMGTLYQIIGISAPTLADPTFLDKLLWFVLNNVMQILVTNWLSELPGDICIWCCARLGLWILRIIERHGTKLREDVEDNEAEAIARGKSD